MQTKLYLEFLMAENGCNFVLIQGFLFLLVGFLFKLGVFPFHLGLIDIYEGASLPLTLYLTTVIKFAILITFIRILLYLGYSLQFV